MDTTLKFDKVILTKELNDKFKKVGKVFEVANIFEDYILLRDVSTRVAIGIVTYDDFVNHFEKDDEFKGWTPWTPFIGFDGQNDVVYKTNRKKVIVKFIKDNIRAESCCHKDDEFNLTFGIHIAYLRCLNKALTKQKTEYEERLKKINHEIADNKDIIKSMVESLEG